MLEREFGCRHGEKMFRRQLFGGGIEMKFAERAVAVDQQVAIGFEPLAHVDHFEQRWILHDEGIGFEDRFTEPDFLVVDAAERNDWGARALGGEAGESLR